MREQFVARNFSAGSLAIIDKASEIVAEYAAQGFVLTLRQLYYQFVARGLIQNKQTEYKRIGSIVNDARLAGLIDWDGIEDRTRNLRRPAAWDSPGAIIEAVGNQYKEDLWRDQEYRPEVWIEKDALVGVIEPVCDRWRLPYFACRGYTSQSEQYRAGKRFAHHRDAGQVPIVFHLGDHDPSGIDMTRDNEARVSMFAEAQVRVMRLALNYAQVEQYDPPPNPAKDTDSRSPGYVEKFGPSSWELDALDPKVIDRLIDDAVGKIMDLDLWGQAMKVEKKNRALIAKVATRWDDVVQLVE